MPADLSARFAKVRENPAAPGARRSATAILAQLEQRRGDEAGLAILVDDAFVWIAFGLAQEARAVAENWLRAGVREAGPGAERRLRRAAAIYTIAIAPAAAAGRLRAITDDPVASAAAVANHVFRGELRAAIELCKARNWFLDRLDAISGVAYGVWALAMLDDFETAFAVIAMWRHRHPSLSPAHDQALLATEARVESIRHHHARELALLEEAVAICQDAGLGLERSYLETSHAIALVRAGELQAAARITRAWGAPVASTETLEVYRNVARTEVALLEGDLALATDGAMRVMEYAEAHGNMIYMCLARFHRVLAATPSTRRALLEEYGRAAAQLQIPLHLRRHRMLEQLTGKEKLVVRTRRRTRKEPLLRLFFPALADLASDLCWDRVQGRLHLSGDGPFSLADHPIVRRVLEAILATASFELPIATLFERVWEMEYEPLRHEGKSHVALHRLRALLDGWHPGADRLIEVRDGKVRIADDASVCVIELASRVEGNGASKSDETLGERVHAFLVASGEASPSSIELRVGISRSALLLVLRRLVADGRIRRVGRARAIRYRAL